jgi:lysozyme family protein
MSAFEESFAKVVGIEGRYSNNPADSGGETMYGVTVRVARSYGYTGPMNLMPLATAHAIYRDLYWDRLRLDRVVSVAGGRVADELFDSAVNCGVVTAATWLQRCLNVLNQQASWWADIATDGAVGNLTLDALQAFVGRRGQEGCTVLLRMLNALQGAHYVTLSESRPKDEAFVYGWFKNRVVMA